MENKYEKKDRDLRRELAALKVTYRRYALDEGTAKYLKDETKALEELLKS